MKKHLVLGILAHVDAGKTTLSEQLLFQSGAIRKMGRVDTKDAHLDTYALEKQRGITIFSKQAQMSLPDDQELQLTLLDTPGHVDFSAEMERTLQVLDMAVLLISGADGVQGHTRTLWNLLERHQIPTVLFVNKMDQPGTDREELLCQLQEKCSDTILGLYNDEDTDESLKELLVTDRVQEELAMLDEALLQKHLDGERIEETAVQGLFRERKLFPCFFGSALKGDGIELLMQGLAFFGKLHKEGQDKRDFAARVYKISRDDAGNRMTFMKITGGTLQVRSKINTGEDEEQVTGIRLYDGSRFTALSEAFCGQVVAVVGLLNTRPGQGLGAETEEALLPLLEPVMTYALVLPEDMDAARMLPKIRQLEEEIPELHVLWEEDLQEIQLQIMGEVQLEIVKSIVKERYDVEISFGCGRIVYKETILDRVEGVGHFEPLRHYAEVHLLLEPLEQGSGLEFATDCPEDVLAKNWQRLILTHLEERQHRGVLTGSVITDMRLTVKSGRAHIKHTEGGDFRQATYRAVRQGLMQAESVLLEPWYAFTLDIPDNSVGRAMTDIEKMCGKLEAPVLFTEGGEGRALLKGSAPVACLQSYQSEVIAYTKGRGRLSCVLEGYGPCHNTEEVLAERNYDPEADKRNPSSSVFCSHGAGMIVPWYEVPAYMQVESIFANGDKKEDAFSMEAAQKRANAMERAYAGRSELSIGTEEIDAILDRNSHANSQAKVNAGKGNGKLRWNDYARNDSATAKPKKTVDYGKLLAGMGQDKPEEYLLVDGYNVIFAWEDLNELARKNIDSARGKLLDILCDYQAMRGCELIAVFDAYRVKGHATETLDYHNIHVVFTAEAETADRYIEKFAHEYGRKRNVTVATSDGVEQIIIMGNGASLLSSRELREEIDYLQKKFREKHMTEQLPTNRLGSMLSDKEAKLLTEYMESHPEE